MDLLEAVNLINSEFKTSASPVIFQEYLSLIEAANAKFNITAIAVEQMPLKLLVDSVLPFKDLLKGNEKLLDIGTGAGLPGLPLKIIFKNLKLTMIESNAKKCEFVESVIKKLNLEKAQVLNLRAEKPTLELQEIFDVVTSRAVADLRIMLEVASCYIKEGGVFIALKSQKFPQELIEAQSALKFFNYKQVDEKNFVSASGMNHTVGVFKKLKSVNLYKPRE